MVLLHWDLVGTSSVWSQKAGSSLSAKPLWTSCGTPTWAVWGCFSLNLTFPFPSCSFYLSTDQKEVTWPMQTHILFKCHLNISQIILHPVQGHIRSAPYFISPIFFFLTFNILLVNPLECKLRERIFITFVQSYILNTWKKTLTHDRGSINNC